MPRREVPFGVIGGGVLAQDTSADTDTAAVETATAWLGIAVAETDGQVVVVRVMPQSPAIEALLVDDVIVAFDGTEIASAAELSELVQAAQPDDSVTLDVLRDGEEVSFDVTLGTAPQRGMGGRGPPGGADGRSVRPSCSPANGYAARRRSARFRRRA